MKYSILLCAVVLTSLTFAQSASKYMNKISEEAKTVRSASWEYTNSVLKNKSATKVEKSRQELIKTIEQAESDVKNLGDFKGQSYYKDSILSFLRVYKEAIVQDYEKILAIEVKAKSTFDLKDKYIRAKQDANNKMFMASEMLDEVEKKFGAEFGVNISQTKSKVAERLKRTNKVFNYYNSIFMLFFSAYAEETFFLEALDTSNVREMELRQANLAANTKESLARLNLKLDFEGDMSVVNTCEKLLNFYQVEAQQDFQKIIDFQIFKAAYRKTKADLEAKSSKTKEEVANFNKLVAEYNQKMNDYNALILDLNARRESLINTWNNVSVEFENKHINE